MSKLVKGITIFTTVSFAGVVIAGTAAASAIAFPIQTERISGIISEEAQAFSGRINHLAGLGRDALNSAFRSSGGDPADGAPGGGRASGGSSNSGAGSGAGGGTPTPRFFHPTQPRNAHTPLGERGLPFSGNVNPGGSVVGGELGGSSVGALIADSGGTNQGLGDPKSADPEKPAATPIPGAVWLLGSGLAAIISAKRYKGK